MGILLTPLWHFKTNLLSASDATEFGGGGALNRKLSVKILKIQGSWAFALVSWLGETKLLFFHEQFFKFIGMFNFGSTGKKHAFGTH